MPNKDQVSHGALWTVILAVGPFFWFNFIEPRLVWSDEFLPVQEATYSIQVDLVEMRIESLEDKIRLLDIKGNKHTLTDEEYYRLKTYQDKKDKLKRKLKRLGG